MSRGVRSVVGYGAAAPGVTKYEPSDEQDATLHSASRVRPGADAHDLRRKTTISPAQNNVH